jgi:hypothetical protein
MPDLHQVSTIIATAVIDCGKDRGETIDLEEAKRVAKCIVVADAPVNGVPGAQTTLEDTNLVFSAATSNAITISDVDANGSNETVTLTVASGTLALGSTTNLMSFTNNASSITLTGTVADINAALDGLTYHGNSNFNGSDSLSITTNDNGNTGGGGAKTDTDSVGITVTPVNDAPAGTDKTIGAAGSHTFVASDFGFTDPADAASGANHLAARTGIHFARKRSS